MTILPTWMPNRRTVTVLPCPPLAYRKEVLHVFIAHKYEPPKQPHRYFIWGRGEKKKLNSLWDFQRQGENYATGSLECCFSTPPPTCIFPTSIKQIYEYNIASVSIKTEPAGCQDSSALEDLNCHLEDHAFLHCLSDADRASQIR